MNEGSTRERHAATNGKAKPSTQSAFADPDPPAPTKSGYLTSEFFQTLFANVIAVVVSVGSVFGHNVDIGGVQGLVAPVAVLAAAIATVFYSRSRRDVKNAVTRAHAEIQVARATQTH